MLIVQTPESALPHNQHPRFQKHFCWQITEMDGHVTGDRMLNFINKRTGMVVPFRKRTDKLSASMGLVYLGILAGCAACYLLWPVLTHPLFWFVFSLAFIVFFQSGYIKTLITSEESTDLSGPAIVTVAGLLLLAAVEALPKQRFIRTAIFVFIIAALAFYVEGYLKAAGIYPSIFPPDHYGRGSFHANQGYKV